MDNCKEMSVIYAGIEFAKRGIHTLSIDGPGQGETQRLRNIHSRYDYEVAGTAAYEYVAARSDSSVRSLDAQFVISEAFLPRAEPRTSGPRRSG